ncbi:MAG: hypothetical protein C0621_09800 [Desulfuromonas sp.]|nr:MAG: hypothetical protein C0621_09800 [Desulfuromonas sp.]
MNTRLSDQMTLLGLGAMVFYGVMLGMGVVSIDVMPQFVISAAIFLTSGRIMRKIAQQTAKNEDEDEATNSRASAADWPWLSACLNWVGAFVVIGIMAIFLMKPIGVSLSDALSQSDAHKTYYSHFVP